MQSHFRENELDKDGPIFAVDFLPDQDDHSEVDCGDSEACHADIGFMFDGENETSMRSFSFSPNAISSKEFGTTTTIHVQVQSIDDDPGAVQSGHYLWPGAPVLAQYLVDIFSDTSAKEGTERCLSNKSVQNVLELGAGCGLASLVAMQLFPEVRKVILTDHDPGTLKLAEENYDATLEQLEENAADITERLPSLSFKLLGWGEKEEITDVMSLITRSDDIGENIESFNEKGGFDLVLGSDLIYSEDVVSPVLFTVANTLSKSNLGAIMIMTQSFLYGSQTEDEINRACLEHNLIREVIYDRIAEGGARVQTFQHRL